MVGSLEVCRQTWCWRQLRFPHPDWQAASRNREAGTLGLTWASETLKPTHSQWSTPSSKATPPNSATSYEHTVAISIQITRGLCGYKSPCPQNKPTKSKPNKKLEVLLHRMWPQEELWPCVPKKLGTNDWLRKYIWQSLGSFQHSSPLPSTLNLSSPWALLTFLIFWLLDHLSILVTRFLGSLPSLSFVSLFFFLFLSHSPTSPHDQLFCWPCLVGVF